MQQGSSNFLDVFGLETLSKQNDPLETGHKLNAHKKSKRWSERLSYVQFTSCI